LQAVSSKNTQKQAEPVNHKKNKSSTETHERAEKKTGQKLIPLLEDRKDHREHIGYAP
jgi:hypothetical protein